MHFLRLPAILLLLLIGFVTRLPAQEAVGRLTGTVVDRDFNQPLGRVTLQVADTGLSTNSADDGSFIIPAVPAGIYTLIAIKDGYATERLEKVIISAGQVRNVEMALTSSVEEMDAEIVIAEEEPAAPINTQIALTQDLKSFASALGAAFISQSGARDAAGAVTKVVGVNVQDGKFVVIRGLDDRYNTVYLNGSRVPSSDPDRRAVPLDLFPAGVIADLTVSKTFLPNLPGEATGGHIAIRTKGRPEKPTANFKFGYSYNTNATGNDDYLTYRNGGTGMFGTLEDRRQPDLLKNNRILQENINAETADLQRFALAAMSPEMGAITATPPLDFSMEGNGGVPFTFFGNEAGIFGGFDYAKRYNYFPDELRQTVRFFQSGPNVGESAVIGQSLRRRGVESLRAGLLLGASSKIGADGEISLTYFLNRLAEDQTMLRVGTNENDGNVLRVNESILYTQRQLQSVLLNADIPLTEDRSLAANGTFAWNKAYQEQPDSRLLESTYEPGTGPGGTGTYATVQRQNPPAVRRSWLEQNDDNVSINGGLDAWLLGEKGDDGVKVSIGGGFDTTERNYRGDSYSYGSSAQNFGLPPASTGNPTTPGDDFIYQLRRVNDRSIFNTLDAAERYFADQNVAAGFGLIDVTFAKTLNVTLGARVETTDIKVNGTPLYEYGFQGEEDLGPFRFLITDEDLAQMPPVFVPYINAGQGIPVVENLTRARLLQIDVLPALAFTWESSEDTKVRFSATRTIARPSFKELAPVVFYDLLDDVTFIGNPDLEMSSISNFDARFEWSTSKNTAALTGFHKSISNPIEAISTVDTRTFGNARDAVVYGMELEYQGSLGFMDEALDDFSMGFNYSKIFSKTKRFQPFLGEEFRRLQGQPDSILNFNLSYENKDLDLFAGIFLNVTGEMVSLAAADSLTPNINQLPVSTLDFSLTKKFFNLAKISFRASNLLDSPTTRVYDLPARPVFADITRGRSYSISLGFEW